MKVIAGLQSLEFFKPDGAPFDGLVPVRGTEERRNPQETTIVDEASSFRHVDYVLFRRFADGRSSLPAAFVVDNSNQRLCEQDIARLHRDLWLYGGAPLLYVAWPTRVDVFSCVRGPDFWDDDENQPTRYSPVERIQVAAEIDRALRQRYSAWQLSNGTFWDDPANSALANDAQAAHRQLIQAIVETDSDLDGETHPVRRRLLLLTVLIKYLEDRGVFPPHWFSHYRRGARCFFDVLRQGTPNDVWRLLDTLEKRFNGDVFCLPNGGEELTESELRAFSRLVEGRTLAGQRRLWALFSFENIPVEVISRLYQRFVKGGHGVVYTPPFLVALLLDHVMPFEKLSGRERVLDPACGSGIFLVGAFRRLIAHWRSQNGWGAPDVPTLRAILRDSIFGIELEPGAVDLTAFSLSLAVCDALKPNVIWNELRFDRLRGNNLREADFFGPPSSSSPRWPETFDVVIGNPPFESKLTEAGKHAARQAANADGLDGGDAVPDKQTAYLFLREAIRKLSDGGRVCLIQPAGFLYNSGTSAFREHVLRQVRVSAVLDFTSIRHLYDGADPKTVAILADSGQPASDAWITHLTFRRTFTALRQIGFEIDHYDHHRFPLRLAIENPLVWRANLLGGGRLVTLSQRLQQLRSLGDFLRERVKEDGWDYGEGFIVGNKRSKGRFLPGMPLLPTSALTDGGIVVESIGMVDEANFEAERRTSLFASPLLLIKEHESLPLAFWNKGPLAYRDKIVGIHAPPEQTAALQAIHDRLVANRPLYRFCLALLGSQGLVGKQTAVLKQDIDSLPYPESAAEVDFAYWETALQDDVLGYMAEFIRIGQNSPLLANSATADDLQRYSELFLRLMRSIYGNLNAHEPIFLDGLTCQPFFFDDRADVTWLGSDCQPALRQLLYDETRQSLRTIRVIRYYAENVILIVKPDRLRYWIPSTAIRDADETFADLVEQGW